MPNTTILGIQLWMKLQQLPKRCMADCNGTRSPHISWSWEVSQHSPEPLPALPRGIQNRSEAAHKALTLQGVLQSQLQPTHAAAVVHVDLTIPSKEQGSLQLSKGQKTAVQTIKKTKILISHLRELKQDPTIK